MWELQHKLSPPYTLQPFIILFNLLQLFSRKRLAKSCSSLGGMSCIPYAIIVSLHDATTNPDSGQEEVNALHNNLTGKYF